jgi:hypothetical protein
VPDNVTISYRGERYEIGRGEAFYGIWDAGALQLPALQSWPATPEGWYAAWARFVAIEVPGTIGPVPEQRPPGAANASAVADTLSPLTSTMPPAGLSMPQIVQVTPPLAGYLSAPALGTPLVVPPDTEPTMAAIATGRLRFVAAGLLAGGVVLGVAGLFPDYLSGTSLAQQPAELVPHVIYLATWALSALLIVLGGSRIRAGALLAAGTSLITLGLFLADAGTPIVGGAHLMGAGLILSLVGWLVCFTGSATAFALQRGSDAPTRPRGPELVAFLSLLLSAIGAAAAFAPAWDSYILQTSAGTTESITAGNIFSNPGAVIAGNVVTMAAIVLVVITAALWRPILHGSFLLAGAIIALTAQAISALVQVGEHTSPSMFGISSSTAAQSGLTITSGLTLAFWIYCIFVLALIVTGASALFARESANPRQVASSPAHPTSAGMSQTLAPEISPLGPIGPGQT